MSKYLLMNGNNGFIGIGSSEANLRVMHPNLDIWHKPQGLLYTISDDDFKNSGPDRRISKVQGDRGSSGSIRQNDA